MDKPAVLEEHYGAAVWTNRQTDQMRRTECLCYNCKNLDFNKPDRENCPMAGTLYQFAKVTNLAMMITRCPAFEQK